MNIAFLNLCNSDPELVARVSRRLTACPRFDTYIHIDAKTDDAPFRAALQDCARTAIIKKRLSVYWGGFHAVEAEVELLRAALTSPRSYDYFIFLQNFDYPLRSNAEIEEFFVGRRGTEFIRACDISNTKDLHFMRKFKIYNRRDDDFYLKPHSKLRMYARYLHMLLLSAPKLLWNGVIHERGVALRIHYGAAQWAVTRECAAYLVDFFDTHPVFNKKMAHIQFPDEEYFHTAVHNSSFKYKCSRYDEPERRWLVNWRNLHYFEYPREITVFTDKDFDKLIAQEGALFIRKVRTAVSDALMDRLDAAAEGPGV
jgi:hypothetical protein